MHLILHTKRNRICVISLTDCFDLDNCVRQCDRNIIETQDLRFARKCLGFPLLWEYCFCMNEIKKILLDLKMTICKIWTMNTAPQYSSLAFHRSQNVVLKYRTINISPYYLGNSSAHSNFCIHIYLQEYVDTVIYVWLTSESQEMNQMNDKIPFRDSQMVSIFCVKLKYCLSDLFYNSWIV